MSVVPIPSNSTVLHNRRKSTSPVARFRRPGVLGMRLLSWLGLRRPVSLIALDLDGTLLDSRKRISARTVKALRLLPEVGVQVVVASARPPRSCRAIYQGLGLSTWQINYNGALIWDPSSDRLVRHWPMSGAMVHRMATLARQLVPGVQVAAEVVDRWYTDRQDPYRTTVTGKLFRPDVVAPMESWSRQETTKLMFLAAPRKVARIREALRKRYGQEAKVVHADPDLVQVMSAEAGKDNALRVVCEHHGIDVRHAMAVGDAINDLDMLRCAGVPVAVANGCDECKLAAKWVAPSNDDEGVYEAVRRFVPKIRPLLDG
jgi:Cof subfamily protein (haloacid dehalogenase superfamily)